MLKLFVALQNRVAELRDREEGQAYVEYGVLLVLVAIFLIATVTIFRDDLVKAFGKVNTAVGGL